MFFLLFGSSGAGKTLALNALRGRLAALAIHDFDEIGVPLDADTAWRHRAIETWVRGALDHQTDGRDFLLAGQTPFGELLAVPSAPRLESLSACLLDCDVETRVARLQARGPEWFARVPGELQDHLNWAEWMRGHAHDPAWRADVIRHPDSEEEMRWERWSDWRTGDPRWRVRVIDTSALPVERVADELAQWVAEERELVDARLHPLLRWANDFGSGEGH